MELREPERLFPVLLELCVDCVTWEDADPRSSSRSHSGSSYSSVRWSGSSAIDCAKQTVVVVVGVTFWGATAVQAVGAAPETIAAVCVRAWMAPGGATEVWARRITSPELAAVRVTVTDSGATPVAGKCIAAVRFTDLATIVVRGTAGWTAAI
jgi:hypothetical protein